MNYCELCGGDIEKDNIHPYCIKYFLQSTMTITQTKVALRNQEDILEIYA